VPQVGAGLSILTQARLRSFAALTNVLGREDAQVVLFVVDWTTPLRGRRRAAHLLLSADVRTGDSNGVDLGLWRTALHAASLALAFDDESFDNLAAAVRGLTYPRLASIAARLRDAIDPPAITSIAPVPDF